MDGVKIEIKPAATLVQINFEKKAIPKHFSKKVPLTELF